MDVGGGSGEGGDGRAQQPGLAVFDDDVALGEVGASRAKALYFPAFQDETGLETVFDEVIVAGLFVVGVGVCGVVFVFGVFVCFFWLWCCVGFFFCLVVFVVGFLG